MKNKKEFYDLLESFNSSDDIFKIFQSIENNINHYAKKIYSDRIKSKKTGVPLLDWWIACSTLLINKQLIISDVNFDDKSDKGKEFIEIYNRGPLIVDISQFSINAGDQGQDFTFPDHLIMYPGQRIKVHTYIGEGFNFNSKRPIWNNKGDVAFLYDNQGDLISSWAYGMAAQNHIKIKYINYDGEEKYTEGDEYVEIENNSTHQIDISGWQLQSNKNQVFTFPNNTSISPSAVIRIYTNFVDTITGGFSFNSATAIWNNKGDKGTLIDAQGKTVDEYLY